MIIGDYLILTDVGFGLLCTFFVALIGILIWRVVLLIKVMRLYYRQPRSANRATSARRVGRNRPQSRTYRP